MSTEGTYEINNPIDFVLGDIIGNPSVLTKDNYLTFYFLFKLDKTIKKPYIGFSFTRLGKVYGIKSCELFKAYTKGHDYFKNADYRYSGRDIFEGNWSKSIDGMSISKIYTREEL
jgi:hypothetical protein